MEDIARILQSLELKNINVITSDGFIEVPALCGRIFAVNKNIDPIVTNYINNDGVYVLKNIYTLTHIKVGACLADKMKALSFWHALKALDALDNRPEFEFNTLDEVLALAPGKKTSLTHTIEECLKCLNKKLTVTAS